MFVGRERVIGCRTAQDLFQAITGLETENIYVDRETPHRLKEQGKRSPPFEDEFQPLAPQATDQLQSENVLLQRPEIASAQRFGLLPDPSLPKTVRRDHFASFPLDQLSENFLIFLR